MDPAHDGQYLVETITCYACRAKEREIDRDRRDEDTRTEGRYYLATLDGD